MAFISRRTISLKQAAHRLHIAPAAAERLVLSGAFPGAVRTPRGVWRLPTVDLERHRQKSAGRAQALTVRSADSRFWCARLGAELCAGDCVQRQQCGDGEGTRDTWRGRDFRSGSCRTDDCGRGAEIRGIVGPVPMRQRAWFYGLQPDQLRAVRRLARVGLLDPVPTIDGLPEEGEVA